MDANKKSRQKNCHSPRKNRLWSVECPSNRVAASDRSDCRATVPATVALTRTACLPTYFAQPTIVYGIRILRNYLHAYRMRSTTDTEHVYILTANHTAFQIHHVADAVRTDDRCPLDADFVQYANSLRRSCVAERACACAMRMMNRGTSSGTDFEC